MCTDELTEGIEEWRPVVGWEDLYEVSSLGRLRSKPRLVNYKNESLRTIKEHLVSLNQKSENGFVYVTLSRKGRHENVKMHELVAVTFLQNPNGYKFVRHVDGNRSNNNISNLEYVSGEPDYNTGDCEWRPVVGWEGYYDVSNTGRLRSVDRIVTRNDGSECVRYGKELILNPNPYGYIRKNLQRGNVIVGVSVHRAVAEAFIPNPDNLPEVGHLNLDRSDNRVENLVWCTRGENHLRSSRKKQKEKVLTPLPDPTPPFMPGEEWRDVEGYEGYYQVSSYGRLFSVPRYRKRGKAFCVCGGCILKQAIGTTGYPTVGLCKDGKNRSHMVHRLVAKAFVVNPCPDEYVEVNHIDENKTNNLASNLEWCTRLQNVRHGTGIQRGSAARDYRHIGEMVRITHDFKAIAAKRSKPVIQSDMEGNFIKRWGSMAEIQRELGFYQSSISLACNKKGNGRLKQGIAYGYRWNFEEDYGCVA